MFRIFLALAIALGSVGPALAASNQIIRSDTLTVGNKTNANKTLKFDLNNGASNPGMRGNDSNGKIEFSHDGTTWKAIGSGSGGSGGINLLADNPDFESGISANWTNSGGSYAALSGAGTALHGVTSARFNASASGQYVRSDAYTVELGLRSGPCVGAIRYKSSEATNLYRLRALDGDDDSLLAYVDLPNSNGLTVPAYVGFTCPSSGTVKLEVYSTGDAADIDIDNGHIGSEVREASVSQATMYGSVTWSGCSASFSRASATLGDSTATPTGCSYSTTGSVSAPASNLPAVRLQNAPPGDYLFVLVGQFGKSASAIYTASFRFSDTTNHAQTGICTHGSATAGYCPSLQGRISYPSGSSDATVRIQMAGDGANAADVVSGGTILVYRFPSQSEIGVRVDQLGWHVDANISGANPDLGTSDQASYIGIENGSLTLTNNSGSGVITAQIPCSSTNAPSGTTCAAGNESVGVSFNVPSAGDVLACVSFAHGITTGASGVVATAFQIVETASNAQTVLQEGKSRVMSSLTQASSSINIPNRNCGTFSFATAGQKTLRLMYEQDVTATVTSNVLIADAAAATGQRDIHWEVYPLNYISGALPIFKGMVTSNSTSRERVERISFAAAANEATICSSSPCTVHAQSGSWVSSVTRSGAGVYVANVASGTFSQTPVCTCTALSTASGGGLCHVIRSSSTSTSLDVRTFQNNLTPADTAVQMICMGPN